MRTIFLLIVSIALMASNHQLDAVKTARSQISLLVLPLQVIVDRPMQFLYWLENSFSAQQEVLEENARLRARQLLLQAKLQRLLSLERENVQLRELLSSSSHFADNKVLVAQLVTADVDPLTQEVIVDKGSRDGIFMGQPVLDAYGVMGQVIGVGPFTSRVLLITDGRSAIPAQDNRTGLRAIVAGTNYSDELMLLYVPDTADIAVGDLFVTSGLGGRFPFGYPIGKIVSIDKKSGERFPAVTIQPSAHVDRSRLVVLLWPNDKVVDVPPSSNAIPAARKPRKSDPQE